MSAGRPINQAAIEALRLSEIRTLGHKEASDALKGKLGIDINPYGVGRLRRIHGITWTNMQLVSNKFRDMRNKGKEPTIDYIVNVFNAAPVYAERLIKRG
jgi:hypothetical protein